MIRVLLWMPDGDRVPGGHRVQIDQTARYLRSFGAEVDVCLLDEPACGLSDYQVVHGFGLSIQAIRAIRVAGPKVVLSTIYWSRDYTAGLTKRPDLSAIARRLRLAASFSLSALRGQHIKKCDALVKTWQDQRVAYEMADLLLPNSETEGRQIVKDLGVSTPVHVTANAVDAERFELPPEGTLREGVLYAGRFEPHKNQLGFIDAMWGMDFPVTLIGQAHPDHVEYYNRCQKRATGNIRIVPGVAHEELVSIYQRTKVHVLPSFFETTGLVSLEAALCGCNIVTTNRGYARDYFGDLCWYCDPDDAKSIRRAVQAAMVAPYNPALRQRVLDHFTWQHTARETLAGYTKVIYQNGVTSQFA